jgi:hypothetical protein
MVVYLRYSQFEANDDGMPKQFHNKASFSSHKSRKKRMLVVFSNISVNGKGLVFLIVVINPNIPIDQRTNHTLGQQQLVNPVLPTTNGIAVI